MNPTQPLTDAQFWDDWWADVPLPSVARRVYPNDYINDILGTLDRHVAPGARVLELGGAPGTFLAYLAQTHECAVSSLDISPRGHAATQHNLALLGINGRVHLGDALANGPDDQAPGPFDVVMSWGLAEHFTDSTAILQAHAQRTKPCGLVIIGFPNFRGLNYVPLRLWAPRLLAQHHLAAMRTETWAIAAPAAGLRPLSLRYCGGLSPRLWYNFDRPTTWLNRLPRLALRAAIAAWVRLPRWLNRWDAPWLSGYWIGVFERTED
jgi:SAM-dependent methyltransferase